MDGGGVSGGKGEWLIVWRGSVEGVGSLAPSKKSTCQIPNNLSNILSLLGFSQLSTTKSQIALQETIVFSSEFLHRNIFLLLRSEWSTSLRTEPDKDFLSYIFSVSENTKTIHLIMMIWLFRFIISSYKIVSSPPQDPGGSKKILSKSGYDS